MSDLIKNDKEQLIRWVKENIHNFIIDMEWKQRHGYKMSYTEQVMLNDYLRILIDIEKWEENDRDS